jgi:hypothetical protein
MSYLEDLRPVADAHPNHGPEELQEVLEGALESLDALSLLTTGQHLPWMASYDLGLLVRARREAMGLPTCESSFGCPRPPEPEDVLCKSCRKAWR